MRIFCWVRAISSRCTELTSSSCSRPRSRSVRAHGHQLLLAPLARLLDGCPLVGGEHHGALELVQDDADGDGDGLGGAALADQALAALGGACARLALGLGGAQQRVGAAVEGASALLGRAQREPGVHLALARLAGCLGELLALGGVGLLVGDVLGGGEARLEVGEAGQVGLAGLPGGGDGPLEALGLALGGAGLGAVLPELLGHRGQGRVGLVELGQGDVDALEAVVAGGLEAGDLEPEPLGGGGGLGERVVASSTAAWISIRLGWLLEPPAAKWVPSRSPSRVTATTSGRSATRRRAAARSSTTATLCSSRASAGRTSSGAVTTSTA